MLTLIAQIDTGVEHYLPWKIKYTVKFFTDGRNTFCEITYKPAGRFPKDKLYGYATCSDKDKYSTALGMEIAFGRAIKHLSKYEASVLKDIVSKTIKNIENAPGIDLRE